MDTEPRKATLRGHGRPERFVYFGMGAEPNTEGVPVVVEDLGRRGYNLINADGSAVEGRFWSFAPATKFWASLA